MLKNLRSNVLRQPLGKWTDDHIETRWPSYYDPKVNAVVIEVDNKWVAKKRQKQNGASRGKQQKYHMIWKFLNGNH